MKRLQDVLALLTDAQAKAAWQALSAHVENLSVSEDSETPEEEPEYKLLAPVVEQLDAVMASVAEQASVRAHDPQVRIVKCFALSRKMYSRFIPNDPKGYSVVLISRGTQVEMYKSKTVPTEAEALTLASKYLAKNPHLVLDAGTGTGSITPATRELLIRLDHARNPVATQ